MHDLLSIFKSKPVFGSLTHPYPFISGSECFIICLDNTDDSTVVMFHSLGDVSLTK